MANLSVIISGGPSRAAYFDRALKLLRNQSLPTSEWELLLIERTRQTGLASECDISWHSNSRHITEERGDGADSWKRTIREASGNILIFVDETTLLDPTYLSDALIISRQWPRLGVWGSGAIDLEFQKPPSKRVHDLALIIASIKANVPQCGNVFSLVEAAPRGPGLCVRAAVADAYCTWRCDRFEGYLADVDHFLLDLMATELSYLACSMGLGTGVFPQLKLSRTIPNARASEEKFLSFRERESILRSLLNFEWRKIEPDNPLFPAGLVLAMRQILRDSGVSRRIRISEIRAALKAQRLLKTSRSTSAR